MVILAFLLALHWIPYQSITLRYVRSGNELDVIPNDLQIMLHMGSAGMHQLRQNTLYFGSFRFHFGFLFSHFLL